MKIHKARVMNCIDVEELLSEQDSKIWEIFRSEFRTMYCKPKFGALIVIDASSLEDFIQFLHLNKVFAMNGISEKHVEEVIGGIQQIEEQHSEDLFWVIH